MKYGYVEYNQIKYLLEKYNITFKDHKEYENYIRDLIDILKI